LRSEIVSTAYGIVHRLCGAMGKHPAMSETLQKWDVLIELLKGIQTELQLLNAINKSAKTFESASQDFVFVPFKGSEIYLLHKAFIDSGGSPNESYKTLLGKTIPSIANKTQRGFSVQSFCKYSDKVDPESKDNVKRFLQRMIRNIDSYD
jgi:hypothetical protein